MSEFTTSTDEFSRLEVMVLTAVQYLNDRAVGADIQTVSTALKLVPHLTGLDLECPDAGLDEAVSEAADRLEAGGHIGETDNPAAWLIGDGSFTIIAIPPGMEQCCQAIEFSVSIYTQGTDDQVNALTSMVLLEQAAFDEGWPRHGSIIDLLRTVKASLDEDTANSVLRGITIATQARLEWPHIKAKL